jgi:hypothetical protein
LIQYRAVGVQIIWSYLGDISFITINTLIDLPVPGLAKIFMQLLMNLIYADLLMTDKWLPQLFYKKDDVDEKTNSLNEIFSENGFETFFLIKNLGSTFLYLIIFLSLIILAILLKAISIKLKFLQGFVARIESKLFWNGSISFINE